ncbi:MAG: acetyl-CoA carboxylase biotin carboxyl carrier protein subunit [Terriglobales bacterium]
MIYEIQQGEQARKVEVRARNGSWELACDGTPLAADLAIVNEHTLSLLIEGRSFTFHWEQLEAGSVWLGGGGREAMVMVRDPRQVMAKRHFEQSGRVRLAAPMAGKVVRLLVAPGERVEAGQGVVVLEAMKMQNEVRSPKSGALVTLAVAAGATVATGQLLAEVE